MSPSPRLALVLVVITCVVVDMLEVDSATLPAHYAATVKGTIGKGFRFANAAAVGDNGIIAIGAPDETVDGFVRSADAFGLSECQHPLSFLNLISLLLSA